MAVVEMPADPVRARQVNHHRIDCETTQNLVAIV